jgi:hypothetical protein
MLRLIMLACAFALQRGRPEGASSVIMCLRGRPGREYQWYAQLQTESGAQPPLYHVKVFDFFGDELIYDARDVAPGIAPEFMTDERQLDGWRRMTACMNAREHMPL